MMWITVEEASETADTDKAAYTFLDKELKIGFKSHSQIKEKMQDPTRNGDTDTKRRLGVFEPWDHF